MIRRAKASDAASIASIYNYYILNSSTTFEEAAVDEQIIQSRIIAHDRLNWWVYEIDNQIVGYTYATIWKPRSAYRFTVETSIYITENYQLKVIGVKLYEHLIEELRAGGFHTLLAGISLPNDISVRFHEKLGFRKVGQLEEVGYKFNRWIDVGYWELNLKKLTSPPWKILP